MEWKNTPDLYNQYENISMVDVKLLKIIEKWGFSFDDNYFYWQPKQRKGKLASVIKRRPLYWYPQKSTPEEKSKKNKHTSCKQLELIL